MDSSESVARATHAALLEVGKHGRRFQSRGIRKYLGYSERSPEAHQMHNVIGA